MRKLDSEGKILHQLFHYFKEMKNSFDKNSGHAQLRRHIVNYVYNSQPPPPMTPPPILVPTEIYRRAWLHIFATRLFHYDESDRPHFMRFQLAYEARALHSRSIGARRPSRTTRRPLYALNDLR